MTEVIIITIINVVLLIIVIFQTKRIYDLESTNDDSDTGSTNSIGQRVSSVTQTANTDIQTCWRCRNELGTTVDCQGCDEYRRNLQ